MASSPRNYDTTSTRLMHNLIEEFGEGSDKVLMMRKLRSFRRQIAVEINKEYDHAVRAAKETTKILY